MLKVSRKRKEEPVQESDTGSVKTESEGEEIEPKKKSKVSYIGYILFKYLQVL